MILGWECKDKLEPSIGDAKSGCTTLVAGGGALFTISKRASGSGKKGKNVPPLVSFRDSIETSNVVR